MGIKTYSQVVKEFDNNLRHRDDELTVRVGDLVRIYKAHHNAQNEVTKLEAKIASLELELDTRRKPEFVCYG